MRVSLVIPYNPLEEVGGLELGTVRLASEFAELGLHVTIVTKGKSGYWGNLPVIGFDTFPYLCHYLVQQGREGNDIVHWMEIFPGSGEVDLQSMTSGILRSIGVKTVLMVATSGNLENRGSGELTTPLLRTTMDAYVISNPEQIDEFSRSGITGSIYQIGFGIDCKKTFVPITTAKKKELRDQLHLPLEKVLCLFVGRFVTRKRPDFLLRSWQSLMQIYDIAELVVVGSGMDQHDSIEQSVRELALETSFIHFRGITPNPEQYYQAADVLLLPSNREGQPNVLIEMLACGNPVIGSDIAGIRELLIDGVTGITFQADDEEAFKSAIIKLVNNHDLRFQLGYAGRNLVADKKDLTKVARKYLELYENIRSSRR